MHLDTLMCVYNTQPYMFTSSMQYCEYVVTLQSCHVTLGYTLSENHRLGSLVMCEHLMQAVLLVHTLQCPTGKADNN